PKLFCGWAAASRRSGDFLSIVREQPRLGRCRPASTTRARNLRATSPRSSVAPWEPKRGRRRRQSHCPPQVDLEIDDLLHSGREFTVIDSYERRALSRRKFAIRAFHEAHAGGSKDRGDVGLP